MENPNWHGFNVLWMFSAGWKEPVVNPGRIHVDENDLKEMKKMGCNFVRLPVDYRFFVHNFNYDEYDEAMLCALDECVKAIIKAGLHCSLNIHRAPGYCINGIELERDLLWRDKIAQDAFTNLWKMLALRYKTISSDDLSFDLLNEPPHVGTHCLTRENHAEIIKRVVGEIRAISPGRLIVIDGLGCGHEAIPELAEFCTENNVIQSGRGYTPFQLTHNHAEWCRDVEAWDKPVWPGMKTGGKLWDRQALMDFYKPWKDLMDKGVAVHMGECGCYNKIDNKVALAWYKDLFGVLNELGIGFALWNFRGPFGVAEHTRPNTCWKFENGIHYDSELVELFKASIK